MQTLVRLKLSELNLETIQKICKVFSFSSNEDDPELIIALQPENDKKQAFFLRLDESIQQIENGESQEFSIEELTSFLEK